VKSLHSFAQGAQWHRQDRYRQVVISNREHLAAVKPDGLFLILELMHFASEILSADVLKNGSTTAVSDKELKMAQALIEV